MMENADQVAGAVQPSAEPQPASQPTATQSAPRKRMSTGGKWAIGLAIVFLLLVLCSCALMIPAFSGSDFSKLSSGDSIALIHIDNTIAGTTGITPEVILDQLDQAVEDTKVKAILLRIDSGGGTVAASQEIMLAVRKASEEKPVVTSVGDICASGAYMIAAQTDEIVAAPGSVVGSIGVIMTLVNVEGLLDKVGLEFTTITEGEFKDVGSMYRSITPSETAMFSEQLSQIREQFVADVAEGRDMDEAAVSELATGWVWLGSEALELGLVDTIGNYDDAVDRAAELGGIEGKPTITTYVKNPFGEFPFNMLGILSPRGDIDAAALNRLTLPH